MTVQEHRESSEVAPAGAFLRLLRLLPLMLVYRKGLGWRGNIGFLIFHAGLAVASVFGLISLVNSPWTNQVGTVLAGSAGVVSNALFERVLRRVKKITRDRRLVANRLAGLAGHIAGSGRTELRADWQAVLAEAPDATAVRAARGMVYSAVRLRLEDIAEQCWRPADAVLRSRTLSGSFVALPTASATWVLFLHGGGVDTLGHAEAITAIGIASRALITGGRKWRGLAPPEHKAPYRRP